MKIKSLVTMRYGVSAMAVLCFANVVAQASTVTVNLGASSQNFTLFGTGPITNPSGFPPGSYGTYTVGQGSSVYDGGTNTSTFTLSGAITGSNTPAFSSGTYAFITQYLGTDTPGGGPNAPQAITSAPNSNFFNYLALAPSTSMTLDLFTTSGTFIIPLVTGGIFDGPGFSFHNVSSTCTGLGSTPCSQAAVGYVNGATIFGPVTISANFATPAQTPLPSTWTMMLSGLAGFGLLAYRQTKKGSAASAAA